MGIEIKGKVALITGANRGIGKTIAEVFLKNGASKVYLAVRDTDSTADLVSQYGDKAVPVHVDMSDEKSIIDLAATASDAQVVVNNAGILIPANPLSENAIDALKQEMDVNVYGLIRMAQAFTPVLEKNSDSALIQLNSVASIKNFADFTTYSASKAASYSITQSLRDYLTPKGITVISVHPGPILTDMAKTAGLDEMGEPPELVADGIIAALKSGQFHLFPDSMARDFERAYKGYADAFVEAPVEA